jgi:ATP-dependent exoDNAse (exonuclease V) beta subunit
MMAKILPMREVGGLLLLGPPDLDQLDQPGQGAPDVGAADQGARNAALNVEKSWIVQAPAGAGKTDLLTQRFLKLLSVVSQPEEILAITFTRAATAEMRTRILAALELAALEEAASDKDSAADESELSPNQRTTLRLARSALARSKAAEWNLLEQPHRLDVQTIDSLCLRLAHGQPLLSRLGGKLSPTEQAAPLYDLAARNTFAQLGQGSEELEAALRHLLLLRDNNLGNCQSLIAKMLERREQWRHLFLLSGPDVDWGVVRARLEAPFREEISRVLDELHQIFSAEPMLVQELLALAQYACDNGSSAGIGLLHGLQTLPLADEGFVEHWACVRNFLLTQKGGWRSSITVRDGFPPDGDGMTKAERAQYKERMKDVIAGLQRDKAVGDRLCSFLERVPTLPEARYSDDQWQTLLSIFRVLRHAVAELHVVFAERNQVDFAELSISAATVLNEEENTRGLLASESKRHLLIDEFQDTSRRQHELIGRLLREWQRGDARTCFLVGDPMQSIYLFRQAEVELFGRVQRHGLDCGSHQHPCASLALTENFRSHKGLVDPLNEYFQAIFGPDDANIPGDVPFSRSNAPKPALPWKALHVHPFFSESTPESRADAWARQVARTVDIVREELRKAEAAKAAGEKEYRIAILGRAKNHLAPIAAALRQQKLAFRAIELESLNERQEIIDLLSLSRALLHPADRVAWLSVLRAPWCGLTLGDLHTLTGADDEQYRDTPIPQLIAERGPLLSAEGQRRLARVTSLLEQAAARRFAQRHAQSVASWIERTWVSVGAPAYLRDEERENAETFFGLLDDLAPDGIAVLDGTLETALERLCAAPDVNASEDFGVQLMTIHKAKGLGFQVVLVPALERQPGGNDSPLVTMLERARQEAEAGEDADEVLIAPLGAPGQNDRTYKWVQAQRRERESGERKRLFYVACTRARQELHLLGTAEIDAKGQPRAAHATSLLKCAWDAVKHEFLGAYAALPAPEVVETRADPAGPVLVTPVESQQEPGVLTGIAASSEHGDADALMLCRVPADFIPRMLLSNVTVPVTEPRPEPDEAPAAISGNVANTQILKRPQGSFEQRVRGNAVHAMLEFLSKSWQPGAGAASFEHQLTSVARSTLRRAGLAPERVDALTHELVPVALTVVADKTGQWLLQPHPEAASEQSWSSLAPGADARLRTLRVDRVFRAGPQPLVAGTRFLWVIDYKTGGDPGGKSLDTYLEAQKEQWSPQLEAYGAALRAYHGPQLELRYGLYFPELLRLKSWEG